MDSAYILLFISSAVRSVASNNENSMGLIILAIIEMPVLILILASVTGRPRRLKVTGLFLGWLFLMFAAFLSVIYVIGFILGLFF